MLRTSIGIHTITVFMRLLHHDAVSLLNDFKEYSSNTGEIKIYAVDDKKMTYNIYFHEEDKGISWRINFWNQWECFEIYSVEATINPKILSGINDYITAANQEDFKTAAQNYIVEACKISKHLGDFTKYDLKRIDYCINFYLPELNVLCTPEQMMELLKRGNKPAHYEEWMKYDEKSHRMKSPVDTIYFKSNSVTINSYLKYHQLVKEYPNNPSLNDSLNIIRFEIQCKYSKVYNMAYKFLLNKEDAKSMLLSDDFSKEIIDNYYSRVIMSGDYYTLSDAVNMVEERCFKGKKETRMIDALRLINQCRGITKAKEKVHPDCIIIFNQALRELSAIGINPVTIPRDWGIKHIPNLLDEYHKINRWLSQI